MTGKCARYHVGYPARNRSSPVAAQDPGLPILLGDLNYMKYMNCMYVSKQLWAGISSPVGLSAVLRGWFVYSGRSTAAVPPCGSERGTVPFGFGGVRGVKFCVTRRSHSFRISTKVIVRWLESRVMCAVGSGRRPRT